MRPTSRHATWIRSAVDENPMLHAHVGRRFIDVLYMPSYWRLNFQPAWKRISAGMQVSVNCGNTRWLSTCCAPAGLLTLRPSYTNLTRIAWRYTGFANMNFVRQGFRKLSSDRQTDRQNRPKLLTTPLRGSSKMMIIVNDLYF